VTDSAKLDLVRSIYAAWERGDFTSVEWAHPGITLIAADGPEAGTTWTGHYRVVAEDYRELDGDRVLILMQHRGHGRASGLGDKEVRTEGANVAHIRDGVVVQLDLYWDRDRALDDLGLSREGDGP
jgi:ketosteroid isomerase-like protein